MRIKWQEKALEDLSKIDRLIAKRIVQKVSWFGENFEQITPETLSGKLKGLYKIRAGDYRAVYSIQKEFIRIEWVGHRKEVYK